ncbi:MAG: hypothetical protein ACTSXC_03560 [Candidatus Freyarchaeota archaeon]
MEASNTSSKIIHLFKDLLENIGIKCRVALEEKEEYTLIRGKMCRRNLLIHYKLRIYGRENILRFAEVVGFSIKRKRERLMRILRRYETLKISNGWIKQTAKGLLAANLVRLGIAKTQYEAARMIGGLAIYCVTTS